MGEKERKMEKGVTVKQRERKKREREERRRKDRLERQRTEWSTKRE